MLSLSLGLVTIVCVCEPRHVCTAAICTGAAMLLTSKMRTPRKRVSAVAAGVEVQSIFPRVSSTDMKSRLPHTDMSPWPPGQTTDVLSVGEAGFVRS